MLRATRSRPGARSLLALGSLILASCGEEHRETFPQTMYAPRSDLALDIIHLQNLTVYLGVGVGILVFALLSYILIRFRHREGNPDPEQVHGNTRLEVAWTLIPALILAVIAVPTVQTIFRTYAVPAAEANPVIVDVIGWQWWWEFQYPTENGDTVITANEIHVAVGRPVSLRLRGGDVMHNFWVPQMSGKRYAIPNRVNQLSFTPTEPGVYLGQCAEFCGTSHALMKMRLIAHAPAEYDAWLAHMQQPAVEPVDSAVMIGKQLVVNGACAGCHIIEGTTAIYGRQGPRLTHFASRGTLAAGVLENNAQNLAAWIRDPQAIKPAALMPKLGLSEQEIAYVVAYLQTLY